MLLSVYYKKHVGVFKSEFQRLAQLSHCVLLAKASFRVFSLDPQSSNTKTLAEQLLLPLESCFLLLKLSLLFFSKIQFYPPFHCQNKLIFCLCQRILILDSSVFITGHSSKDLFVNSEVASESVSLSSSQTRSMIHQPWRSVVFLLWEKQTVRRRARSREKKEEGWRRMMFQKNGEENMWRRIKREEYLKNINIKKIWTGKIGSRKKKIGLMESNVDVYNSIVGAQKIAQFLLQFIMW